VEDARADEPAGAGLKAVGLGEVKDAVIALVPVLDALADLSLGGAGFEAEEGVGEVVADVVMLRREVVGLGLPSWPTSFACLALWCMWRGWAHVVEELRIDRPLAILPQMALPTMVAPHSRRLAQVKRRLPRRS